MLLAIKLIATLAAVAGILFLLAGLVQVVKTCRDAMQGMIDEMRTERQLLQLQEKIVTEIKNQTAIQRQIIEKQLSLALNAITAMKLLQDKQADPTWIDRFDQGRDNARYN